MTELLFTFYGDDFTGSTDAMEALALGGLRTVLFLEPPSVEQLTGRFADLQAIGVAGVSRSMTPTQMEAELRPKFKQLKQLGAPLCHYKVCSTFDSSPTIGSIGRATDIGYDVFEPPFVPLMVGALGLKRYVVFGNLFASVGAETFRIDRHPTMSRHPSTPMDEGDLRLHLAKQTDKSITLMDLRHLADDDETVEQNFQEILQDQPDIILFDTLDDAHLLKIGRLIWDQAMDAPLFVVGSSGVEYALTAHWQRIGMIDKPDSLSSPGPVDQLLVMSGSASPTTASQISWAIDNGFVGIQLDSSRLIDPDVADAEREATIQKALAAIGEKRDVVLYSVQGPDDPAIESTRNRMAALELDPSSIGQRLGAQQGRILRTLLEKTGLRRVCVAGGDTSGHSALQLGIYALELEIPIAPGAPICRASSHQPTFDGLQICLKGGQCGEPEFFNQIKQGKV